MTLILSCPTTCEQESGDKTNISFYSVHHYLPSYYPHIPPFFLQVQELNTFFENCCTIDRDLQNVFSVFCAYNCVSFHIVIAFLHNTFVLLHLTKSTEFSDIVHYTIAVGGGNWVKLNKIDEMQPIDHGLAVGFPMLLCSVSGSVLSHCVMIIIISSFICECILCIRGTVAYQAAIGHCASHAQWNSGLLYQWSESIFSVWLITIKFPFNQWTALSEWVGVFWIIWLQLLYFSMEFT